jgi:hypothetical protein
MIEIVGGKVTKVTDDYIMFESPFGSHCIPIDAIIEFDPPEICQQIKDLPGSYISVLHEDATYRVKFWSHRNNE